MKVRDVSSVAPHTPEEEGERGGGVLPSSTEPRSPSGPDLPPGRGPTEKNKKRENENGRAYPDPGAGSLKASPFAFYCIRCLEGHPVPTGGRAFREGYPQEGTLPCRTRAPVPKRRYSSSLNSERSY